MKPKFFESLERRVLMAADFVYDLRIAGGAKAATVAAGGTVALEVFVLIADGNGNTTDEGMQIASGGVHSSTGGLLVDLSPLAPQFPFNSTPSGTGKNIDLDADGDKDAGGASGETASAFFFATSGIEAIFEPTSTQVINGITYSAFRVGKTTATVKSGSPSTTINFFPRITSAGTKPQTYYKDGVFTQLPSTDARIGVGTPVVLTNSASPPPPPPPPGTDTTPPTATLNAATLTAGGGASYTFKVAYTDASGVNTSTIGKDEIKVTGPAAFSQTAKFISLSGTTATYQITANDGIIDALENGFYTAQLQANRVKDTLGNTLSAVKTLGNFSFAVPSVVKSPTGVLVIDGSGSANALSASGSSTSMNVNRDGVTTPWTSVTKVIVNGVGGNDNINLSACSVTSQIDGGSGDDIVTGGSAVDRIKGGDGNDNLAGGLGNDIIDGGLGADIFNGGGGSDTADYGTRTTSLVITIEGVANDGATAEGDNVQTTIENINSGSGNDKITGSSAANVINGNAGNDNLSGVGGNDVLNGGLGDDALTGGGGVDQLFGNDGFDWLYSRDGVAGEIVSGGNQTDHAQYDSGDTRTSIEITLA